MNSRKDETQTQVVDFEQKSAVPHTTGKPERGGQETSQNPLTTEPKEGGGAPKLRR
ncbi:hypothetical protein NKK52_30540 [Mesorhizobium sp. C277A]|uniref:Uncharacterized protein n=1 Tax=Mesorhizobium caraganae TaxID=483206 RepID=A0ABV1Z8D6_9HYPH|nr:hypothetical protein [Mesorhizobium sp. LSJC277A00]